MTDMETHFQNFLNHHREDLTDAQIDEFYERLLDLRDEVADVAECDHENTVAHIPPELFEKGAGAHFSPTMEEGLVTALHGKCEDCGASVDAAIEITTHHGDDVEEVSE